MAGQNYDAWLADKWDEYRTKNAGVPDNVITTLMSKIYSVGPERIENARSREALSQQVSAQH